MVLLWKKRVDLHAMTRLKGKRRSNETACYSWPPARTVVHRFAENHCLTEPSPMSGLSSKLPFQRRRGEVFTRRPSSSGLFATASTFVLLLSYHTYIQREKKALLASVPRLLPASSLHSCCTTLNSHTPFPSDWRSLTLFFCNPRPPPKNLPNQTRAIKIKHTCMVSKGVLARAEWVRKDLEDQGHLRALLGPGGDGARQRRRPRFPDYSLRLTGHSLGGSTGVLLAFMLRRDYPSVRCVSISPLGGLINSPHAESCGEFVLSAALGEDVVPRLSVVAMERMRDEVLELIARAKV